MFTDITGQKVPAVTFPIIADDGWTSRDYDNIFANKTVVVFSLPGAFTPTCSSSHLPRYNELAPTFFANGVDEIVCVSVNDTFVMNAWAKDQNASNISFIPDGNGEFTKKMGALVKKNNLGFGDRSWRYSMIVDNGKIIKVFSEPNMKDNHKTDPFSVSSVHSVLKFIGSKGL